MDGTVTIKAEGTAPNLQKDPKAREVSAGEGWRRQPAWGRTAP